MKVQWKEIEPADLQGYLTRHDDVWFPQFPHPHDRYRVLVLEQWDEHRGGWFPVGVGYE